MALGKGKQKALGKGRQKALKKGKQKALRKGRTSKAAAAPTVGSPALPHHQAKAGGGPKGARPKNKGRPEPKAAPEVKEEEGSWVEVARKGNRRNN